jgi:N,N-dimethylformamidase beta subunit-like, C-terminal
MITAMGRAPARPPLATIAGLVAVALLTAACTASVGGAPAGNANRLRTGKATGAGTSPAASPLPFPVAENKKPGTDAWIIRHEGARDAIQGYADHVSVLPGQPFRLYVSTTAASFRVKAYRIGWYGGREGRLVWSSGSVPGRVQPPARLAAGVNMVTAPWHPSLTVQTTDWPEGAYLLVLVSPHGQRYVPITVRSPSAAGKVVILQGVTTWQAYNLWGGYDLYGGRGGFADRSREVSFDRPYATDGAQWFLSFELAPIALAERSGVPLAYETDVDLDRDPSLLSGSRAVISLGHDEYYSAAMRTALVGARHAGTNIAFLGANAMYRHIRFASSALGADRIEICYKIATEDPLYGKDNGLTTQNWRDPPHPRPESVITGVFYECNPVSDPYVVYDPGNWIFAGTGVLKGTSFPGMVGPEYDRVNPAVPIPRPIEVLAHSPLSCDGAASYADSAYYTTPSGAGVFASGTMRWVCAMRGPACGHGVGVAARDFVDRATLNLLRVFAAGPAGLTHPAHDNLAAVKPVTGTAYEGVG